MPTNTKNLTHDDKFRVLSAATAAPGKNKAVDAVYNELNTQTNNTTSADKSRIDRANVG